MGLHHPAAARHFDACMVSINTIATRKSDLPIGDWIMDSGAFTTIAKHGGYPEPVCVYAAHIRRWRQCGNLLAAVAQDYMCETDMLERTGLTVADHQRLTVERYDALLAEELGVYLMPVLQGYAPEDYLAHLRQYGERLAHGAWVGVGSVCKRNGSAMTIGAILWTIKQARPDLRLHGFGLKATALGSSLVVRLLHSADSMAWSYAARKQGRNQNDWREAKRWIAPGELLG